MSRPATSPRRRTSSARRDPASTGIHRQGARNTVPGALSCARAVTPGGPGRRMSRCRTPTEWLLPPDGRTAARFGRRSVPGLMRGRGPSPTREPPGGSGSLVDPGAAGGGTRLRDVRGGTGDLRTVAGRQMAVTAARHLYRGRCLAHVPVRGLPAAGTADRTALVYRWRGLPYRSSRSAISTIRPRCITAARCEGWRTMARSGRLRLRGRRAGHPDAPALTAGELVREAVVMFRIEPHDLQESGGPDQTHARRPLDGRRFRGTAQTDRIGRPCPIPGVSLSLCGDIRPFR